MMLALTLFSYFQDNLCLVKFPEMQLVKTIPSGRKQNICAVVCHPESNEAIFADIGGHWGLLEEIEVGGASSSDVGGLGVNKEDQEDMEALFNDDDEDDENSFSVAKEDMGTVINFQNKRLVEEVVSYNQ